jgi:16S rRNA pseudouridine516 synthase
MRIDKYISSCGVATRREAAAAAKRGLVCVNGKIVRDLSAHIDPDVDEVSYEGSLLVYRKYTYIMMNKPSGVVSSTDEPGDRTVMDLLDPELQRIGAFPCGRLDRDTTGLLLITNDGETAHRLLSPKKHAEKRYRFTVDLPLPRDAEERFLAGIVIDHDELCRPAKLECEPDRLGGTLILTEGKFHQVKRMIAALGSTVTSLCRLNFGPLSLDDTLEAGEWRLLREDEIALLPRPTNE